MLTKVGVDSTVKLGHHVRTELSTTIHGLFFYPLPSDIDFFFNPKCYIQVKQSILKAYLEKSYSLRT